MATNSSQYAHIFIEDNRYVDSPHNNSGGVLANNGNTKEGKNNNLLKTDEPLVKSWNKTKFDKIANIITASIIIRCGIVIVQARSKSSVAFEIVSIAKHITKDFFNSGIPLCEREIVPNFFKVGETPPALLSGKYVLVAAINNKIDVKKLTYKKDKSIETIIGVLPLDSDTPIPESELILNEKYKRGIHPWFILVVENMDNICIIMLY